MSLTYEEIRVAALDILARRVQVPYEPSQYDHLSLGLCHLIARREGRAQPRQFSSTYPLDVQDRKLLLTFAQKAKLFPQSKSSAAFARPDIIQLNTVRNKFGHHLNHKIESQGVYAIN